MFVQGGVAMEFKVYKTLEDKTLSNCLTSVILTYFLVLCMLIRKVITGESSSQSRGLVQSRRLSDVLTRPCWDHLYSLSLLQNSTRSAPDSDWALSSRERKFIYTTGLLIERRARRQHPSMQFHVHTYFVSDMYN